MVLTTNPYLNNNKKKKKLNNNSVFMQDMIVDNMWFQQDGATCHVAQETIQLLHESFPVIRVISYFDDQNWSNRAI